MNKARRLVKQGGDFSCWDLLGPRGFGSWQAARQQQAKPKAKQATTTTLQHDVVDQAEV